MPYANTIVYNIDVNRTSAVVFRIARKSSASAREAMDNQLKYVYFFLDALIIRIL
jgi:hypothetical protein